MTSSAILALQVNGWRRIVPLIVLLCAWLTPQLGAVEDRREFDLPSVDAATALKLFSEQSGRGVIVAASVIEGVRTDRVQGRFTADEALTLMLARTGLIARQDGKTKAFAIMRAQDATTAPPQKKNPGRAGGRDGVSLAAGEVHPKTVSPMKRLFPKLIAGLASLLISPETPAQPTNGSPNPSKVSEDTLTLSPFEVVAAEDKGYVATSTLGGTLIRTNLSDVGSSISVYTKEFLDDLAAFDNESLLAFTVNADVGGVRGTFVNANSQGEENDSFGNGNANTRVRGLAAADNTTDYFRSEIPWDGYSTDRIDMVRGANSLLFGLGSPAGIINATQVRALNKNRGRLQHRTDEWGTHRFSLDYNHVLLDKELSARIAILSDHTEYKQNPAFKDDERYLLTARYLPRLLQSSTSTFRIDVTGETGRITSNSRRSQPPVDNLTYYFLPRAEGGPGGQPLSRLDPNDASIFFIPGTTTANPLLSNLAGGPIVLYYDRTELPVFITETSINSVNGYRIQANPLAALVNAPAAPGSSATSIGLNNNLAGGTVQPVTLEGARGFALLKGLPFASRYADANITDTGIYDFYNQLIDGQSKREIREFTRGRADVSHTFFNNRLSYALTYVTEEVEFDRYAALGTNTTLEVDVARELPDGSLNPFAGRPFIREVPFVGSRFQTFDTDAWRAVGLYRHDFRRGKNEWLARLLGSHDLTAIVSGTDRTTERFDYLSNGVGQSWIDSRLVQSNALLRTPFNSRTVNAFYLGDSVSGRALGSQLGLNNIGPGRPVDTGFYPYRYFDASVAGFNPNVSPIAADPVFGRAALNPANYRGWTTGQLELVGAPTNEAAREYLTRAKDYFKEETNSLSFAWQGRFLNGGVVGTYGWREDDYSTWIYNWNFTGAAFDRNRAAYGFDPIEKKGTSSNWSVALHTHRFLRRMPFELTFYANRGENTNPDPSRIGVFREPILSAKGKTEDYSMEVRSRENKWSARLTRYETSVDNASSQATIQSQKFRLEQAFWQSFNGVYRILVTQEAPWGSISQNLLTAEANGTLTAAQRTQLNAQRVNVPNNVALANQWLDFERRFADTFPDAVAAWLPAGGVFPGSTAVQAMRWSYPENAVFTEDTVSKGWELELVANPTPNWRILVNASKGEATRQNLPGPRFREVMDFLINEFNGPLGLIPGSFVNADGSAGASGTPRAIFEPLVDAYLVQIESNGQRVTELSEYRANIVTNYTFRTGKLRGFEVGGSFRYESPKSIGYGYKLENNRVVPDLSQQFEGDSTETAGLSLRYRYRLAGRYHCSIQFNIDNVFQGRDEIRPISVQPDGSGRRYMIREGRSWILTNTMEF